VSTASQAWEIGGFKNALESAANSRLGERARGAAPPQPAARTKSTSAKRRRPTAARHSRKCSVCHHADRAAIDQDFLAWHSPDRIAKDYGIADHSSIYRHAHATGLFDKRANTIRLALAPLIERAATVEVTADAIIRAVYVFTNLDDDGKWAKPKPNRQTAEFMRHAND
jgi:hypothetical protein